MSLLNDATVFRDALAQLRNEPCTLSWLERRDFARTVLEAIKVGTSTKEAMELVPIFAVDPKWEVRLAITEGLPWLPDRDFKRLREILSADGNNYVRAAVEKAVALRLERARGTLKAKKSRDQVSDAFHRLELEHGTALANRAKQICDKSSQALCGALVHDLRSVLTPLKANCATLIDRSLKRGEARDRSLSDRIENSFQLLQALLSDVEAFTRSIDVPRRPEQLLRVVTDAHELARNNLEQIGFRTEQVEVSVQLSDEFIVEIALNQVVLALANVLKNAYESFVDDRGELGKGNISVAASSHAGSLELVIKDNGMGMSEEEKRGFQTFTPGNRNKSKRHSTGYGLPIAQRYIHAHGGTLSIESQEDHGTTVKITLPLAE